MYANSGRKRPICPLLTKCPALTSHQYNIAAATWAHRALSAIMRGPLAAPLWASLRELRPKPLKGLGDEYRFFLGERCCVHTRSGPEQVWWSGKHGGSTYPSWTRLKTTSKLAPCKLFYIFFFIVVVTGGDKEVVKLEFNPSILGWRNFSSTFNRFNYTWILELYILEFEIIAS